MRWPVSVTGATGYISGRLVPRLLDAGYEVACSRSLHELRARPWANWYNVVPLHGFVFQRMIRGIRSGERVVRAERTPLPDAT